MCPLQIINDIESLSLTLHGVNTCFIHHLSNVENYSIDYELETGQPKKRDSSGEYIFTHLYWFWAQNHCLTFLTSEKLALNGPANSPVATYSKI